MQIGLVGPGRTGANISRRLMRAGHPSVDVGPSGRVWGLARGYCLMIVGDTDTVNQLDPRFAARADVLAASQFTRFGCRRRHAFPETPPPAIGFGGHIETGKT